IQAFEKVSGQKLPYDFAPRREGDITSAYADTTKANEVLNWKAEYGIEDAMQSAWKWQQQLQEKEDEEI
ncbi:UDP-glucose 4-epimerase GalE, partial [Tamlana crocina]